MSGVQAAPHLAIEIPSSAPDDGDSNALLLARQLTTQAPDNLGLVSVPGGASGVAPSPHEEEDVQDEDNDDAEDDSGGDDGEASPVDAHGPISPLPPISVKVEAGSGGSGAGKRKRNLPGTPDPDAEVVALSPRTLLATNRFVCEICNKGFQRDQNLQLHRRGHNLPWKLRQRTTKEVKKKVYICPETTCIHHDPSRALGDLTGIKKHFCRKHGEKKYKCDKCSKRYAVQSDWKAHLKTCGTREYRCDCGTLFSRRDSFITHRAFCDALTDPGQNGVKGELPDGKLVGVASGNFNSPQGTFSNNKFAKAGQDAVQQDQSSAGGQSGLNLWLGQNSTEGGQVNAGGNNPLAAAAALVSQQLLQNVGSGGSSGGAQQNPLLAAASKLGLSASDLTSVLSGNVGSSASMLLQQRAMQNMGGSQSQGQQQNPLLNILEGLGHQQGGGMDSQILGQSSSLLANLLGGGGGGHGGNDGGGPLAGLLGNSGSSYDNGGGHSSMAPAPPTPSSEGGGGQLHSLLQQALGASGINLDPNVLAAVMGGNSSHQNNNNNNNNSGGQPSLLARAAESMGGQGQGQGNLSSLASLLNQMGGSLGGGSGGGGSNASLLLQRAAQRLAGAAAPAPAPPPPPPPQQQHLNSGHSSTAALLRSALGLPPEPPQQSNGGGGNSGGGPLAALSALFPNGIPMLNTSNLPATGGPEASQGGMSGGNSAGNNNGPGHSVGGGGALMSPPAMSHGGSLEYYNNPQDDGNGGGGGASGGLPPDLSALAGRLLGDNGLSNMPGLSELLSSMASSGSQGAGGILSNLLSQAAGAGSGSGHQQSPAYQTLANNPGLLGQDSLNALQRAQGGDMSALGMVTRDFLGLAPNMSPDNLTLAALTAQVEGAQFDQFQGQGQHYLQQPQQQQQLQHQPQGVMTPHHSMHQSMPLHQ